MIPELPGPSVDKGKGSPFRPTLKKMGGGRSNTSTPTKFLGELDPDFQPFDKPFIGRLHMLKYTECQKKHHFSQHLLIVISTKAHLYSKMINLDVVAFGECCSNGVIGFF